MIGDKKKVVPVSSATLYNGSVCLLLIKPVSHSRFWSLWQYRHLDKYEAWRAALKIFRKCNSQQLRRREWEFGETGATAEEEAGRGGDGWEWEGGAAAAAGQSGLADSRVIRPSTRLPRGWRRQWRPRWCWSLWFLPPWLRLSSGRDKGIEPSRIEVVFAGDYWQQVRRRWLEGVSTVGD